MLSWARALLHAEEGRDTNQNANGRDRVTRQELAAMFADELAQKVLQKRTISREQNTRSFMAGRQSYINK